MKRGPTAEVLHVTVTLCVKCRCGDFTTVAAAAETAGISQRMYSKQNKPCAVVGCNWAGRQGEVIANVSGVILQVCKIKS